MKKINLFDILVVIIIVTIFIFILSVNKIEKTNLENQLYSEQLSYFNNYISENLESSKTEELLDRIVAYIEKNNLNPELVPDIEFYGKDNNNHKIIYMVEDNMQKENYINEIKEISTQIGENDKYFIVYEYDDNQDYIVKIVIEYNYFTK